MQNKLFNRLLAIATLTGICSAIVPVFFAGQASAQQAEKKVTICHSTSSQNNPYNIMSINKNALDAHLSDTDDFFLHYGDKKSGETDSTCTSVANNSKAKIPLANYTNTDFKSDSTFKRATNAPTTFHTTTYANGKKGVAAFGEFVNKESQALDLNALNARKLDTSKLKILANQEIKIYFIHEGAGYRNQMKIKTSGTTTLDKMVFYDASLDSRSGNADDALLAGDYVNVGTLQAGTNLDFQLLADGYNNASANTWFIDKTQNTDNQTEHLIAYQYGGYLVLGWEDLYGGGDKDYNDLVIAVDIGQANLQAIPSKDPLPAPKIGKPTTPTSTLSGTTRINSTIDVKVDINNDGKPDEVYKPEVKTDGTWTVNFSTDKPIKTNIPTDEIPPVLNNTKAIITVVATETTPYKTETSPVATIDTKIDNNVATVTPTLGNEYTKESDYDDTPTFQGTANPPGGIVTVKNGNTDLCFSSKPVVVNRDGTWSCTADKMEPGNYPNITIDLQSPNNRKLPYDPPKLIDSTITTKGVLNIPPKPED